MKGFILYIYIKEEKVISLFQQNSTKFPLDMSSDIFNFSKELIDFFF